MSEDKIEEGYQRFNDFEKQLLGVTEITWKPDDEITAQIHLDILKENFGEQEVNELLDKNGIEIIYLANHETFLKISDMLKQ